jgi:hypothetical protein
MKQTMIVMSIGSAVRLILITALVIALLILAMSGAGTPAPDAAVGAPTPPAAVQSHG